MQGKMAKTTKKVKDQSNGKIINGNPFKNYEFLEK